MAKQFYEDTTSLSYAEHQDMEAERENQRQWWEEFKTEQQLCDALPAAAEYFRALHMEGAPF